MDDTECGPIACYHAWETIDPMSAPANDLSILRHHVIQELNSMWTEFNPCLRVRLPIALVTEPSLIVRQSGVKKDIHTMTVDESDKDNGECPICFSRILQADIFQARPCNHYYHVNCILEKQRGCLITMNGIVCCVKCQGEIINLDEFQPMAPMEKHSLAKR